MKLNRRDVLAAASATLVAHWSGTASAQQPRDLARIYVGFTPGTTPDILARKVAERITGTFARSVVVENRLGAGGQLAVTAVKGASPDGSNILLTAMSMLGVYPFTYKKLPYEPFSDLAPVSMGATFDYGIGVGPAVPESVQTVQDLMAWFRANPGQANIGSPATGSTLHFVSVMLGRAADVPITHVGYKGSSAAIQDMLGGSLPALCTPLGTLFNQPKLRILGSSGANRSRFAPAVPTLVEQGFKGLQFSEWYGFYLPSKASRDVVGNLNLALREALASKAVGDALATFGMEVASSTPEQLNEALKEAQRLWAPIVKSVGFSADS